MEFVLQIIWRVFSVANAVTQATNPVHVVLYYTVHAAFHNTLKSVFNTVTQEKDIMSVIVAAGVARHAVLILETKE